MLIRIWNKENGMDMSALLLCLQTGKKNSAASTNLMLDKLFPLEL